MPPGKPVLVSVPGKNAIKNRRDTGGWGWKKTTTTTKIRTLQEQMANLE